MLLSYHCRWHTVASPPIVSPTNTPCPCHVLPVLAIMSSCCYHITVVQGFLGKYSNRQTYIISPDSKVAHHRTINKASPLDNSCSIPSLRQPHRTHPVDSPTLFHPCYHPLYHTYHPPNPIRRSSMCSRMLKARSLHMPRMCSRQWPNYSPHRHHLTGRASERVRRWFDWVFDWARHDWSRSYDRALMVRNNCDRADSRPYSRREQQ